MIEWPEEALESDLGDLIKQLLTVDPAARLGSFKGGAKDVEAHALYGAKAGGEGVYRPAFDWEAMRSQVRARTVQSIGGHERPAHVL